MERPSNPLVAIAVNAPTAQRPDLPIWMGAGSENSILWVAAQRFWLLLGQYPSPLSRLTSGGPPGGKLQCVVYRDEGLKIGWGSDLHRNR
jgi:hypothetical protein